MLNIPSELANPVVVAGQVASKIMLDLTVYLLGPSEEELEYLVDFYERICPPDRLVRYKIAEIEHWSAISRPDLTASGRAAASAGIRRPFLEPARRRIRDGRAFEIQFWDGRSIDDPEGSWSFSCRRIHLRSSGLHAFVRILLPITAELDILRRAAAEIAGNVELYSGHGGLVFVYDPWLKEDAFDAIYAQARRFWGVDVEDLNGTVPLMKTGIKAVNWITLVGRDFASDAQIEATLNHLKTLPGLTVQPCRQAVMLIAGSQPVVGDQNRPDNSLDPYYAAARALERLLLADHPDFSGERFISNQNTVGWIRRFIDPKGWR
jgi:Type VI immunity for VRR-NUC